MTDSSARQGIPLTRVLSILPFVRWLDSAGVATGTLLSSADINPALLNYPVSVIPLKRAFLFGELACREIGSEHFGLHVGYATSIDSLGAYGRELQSARTVREYLQKGISLFNLHTTGQRLELQQARGDCILRIASIGRSGVGEYQSHLEILAITVAKCREGVGPRWSPPALSLAFKSRERLPPTDLFANTRITRGAGETSMTIPRSILELPLSRHLAPPGDHGHPVAEQPLPGDLGGMVQLQVEALLSDPYLTIDVVARSLGWSTRSLQRHLALQGITFSQLMSEIRLHHSRRWLEQTEKPILEIAMELGYRDASNFTRAFRRRLGISPQAFRDTRKAA